MHYNFTIKGDENKGLSVAIHEWGFTNAHENNCILCNFFEFEKKYEDDYPYYEQKNLGKLLIPIPEFEDLGIDEDNYDDFKDHIIKYLKTTFLF